MLYEHPPHRPVKPKSNLLLFILLLIITAIIIVPLLWHNSNTSPHDTTTSSEELTLPPAQIITEETIQAPQANWHSITVKAGTNLSNIFHDQGLSDKTLQNRAIERQIGGSCGV